MRRVGASGHGRLVSIPTNGEATAAAHRGCLRRGRSSCDDSPKPAGPGVATVRECQGEGRADFLPAAPAATARTEAQGHARAGRCGEARHPPDDGRGAQAVPATRPRGVQPPLEAALIRSSSIACSPGAHHLRPGPSFADLRIEDLVLLPRSRGRFSPPWCRRPGRRSRSLPHRPRPRVAPGVGSREPAAART